MHRREYLDEERLQGSVLLQASTQQQIRPGLLPTNAIVVCSRRQRYWYPKDTAKRMFVVVCWNTADLCTALYIRSVK